jgi:hypothetical protein
MNSDFNSELFFDDPQDIALWTLRMPKWEQSSENRSPPNLSPEHSTYRAQKK